MHEEVSEMMSAWLGGCKKDGELRSLLGSMAIEFNLAIGMTWWHWAVSRRRIIVDAARKGGDFDIVIPEEVWSTFIQSPPPAGYTTLQAMLNRLPGVTRSGSAVKWAQSAASVERLLTLARGMTRPYGGDNSTLSLADVTGRYIQVKTSVGHQLLYYEQSGQGSPILFLHTAGSDLRQYHSLLGDPALQQHWHMVAFDLPGHGHSPPPDGWWAEPYELSADRYIEYIFAFLEAIDLRNRRPVILGCSMAGAVALIMASEYGEVFSGVISCEAAFNTQGRRTPWANDPQVNAEQYISTWIGGMMAPESPEEHYRTALWHYGQGGPGVYLGDLAFYSRDWPQIHPRLSLSKCPLWVMVGEYDYSCSPEVSQRAAEKMGGHFTLMPSLGHFPMVENPERFREYLLPILTELRIR